MKPSFCTIMMDVTVLNELVSLPLLVIKRSKIFSKLSQLYKNTGHFT